MDYEERAIRVIPSDEEIKILKDAYEIIVPIHNKFRVCGMKKNAEKTYQFLEFISKIVESKDIVE
jgi:hypothetical protein